MYVSHCIHYQLYTYRSSFISEVDENKILQLKPIEVRQILIPISYLEHEAPIVLTAMH